MNKSPSALAIIKHIDQIDSRAAKLKQVLIALETLGPQGTWLGSRTLLEHTPEYKWAVEVATLLAALGIGQRTGGGSGLMEAPHLGCHLAKRPDRAIAICAGFIGDGANPFARVGGRVFDMPDFNSRHDALFVGSLFYILMVGRLGTKHEEFDLLNRLKHGLLADAPVFFIERHGYYSKRLDFLTTSTGEELGPRISPADYKNVKIIDLTKMTAPAFVELLLKAIDWSS